MDDDNADQEGPAMVTEPEFNRRVLCRATTSYVPRITYSNKHEVTSTGNILIAEYSSVIKYLESGDLELI